MKSTARNISVLNEYEDSVWLTHTCGCGCEEQITLEITSPDDMELVSIDLYATVTGFNRGIKLNVFKQFFSNVWWRITTSLKVLFKGEVRLQTGICITSSKGIEDYIKALTEASGVFKGVDNLCKKKN